MTQSGTLDNGTPVGCGFGWWVTHKVLDEEAPSK
jgi:hypothetical protein